MKISTTEIEELTNYMEKLVFQIQEDEHDLKDKCCASLDLGLHEWKILVFLGQNGPSKMKDIGNGVSLTLSNLTSIVDKLESKGVAVRIRSEQDRRIVMVHLAITGKEIFNTHHEVKLQISRAMLEKLSTDERKVYLDLMRKITGAPK